MLSYSPSSVEHLPLSLVVESWEVFLEVWKVAGVSRVIDFLFSISIRVDIPTCPSSSVEHLPIHSGCETWELSLWKWQVRGVFPLADSLIHSLESSVKLVRGVEWSGVEWSGVLFS